ncbi:uncharacterized protein HMPREF1120_06529 [Exophiala dermatitidis NIH/UT8656]|uniref:Uncharacterized protein n=1 Tax=Exophiala dermatitidis (strain ATCC 34100 / CBS 525.76 / NIH/UT8656) TaxID=858893 RepID=H6C4U2_EXODN|nr:uncharacterized protein HMPREF1120_06529 [Exophiala dermatitidis NIH/UT8656]EHY58519.1 hypothetical protein HMPREF1120_06529 [Exophiala dermatitidis NIH/UT8656]
MIPDRPPPRGYKKGRVSPDKHVPLLGKVGRKFSCLSPFCRGNRSRQARCRARPPIRNCEHAELKSDVRLPCMSTHHFKEHQDLIPFVPCTDISVKRLAPRLVENARLYLSI